MQTQQLAEIPLRRASPIGIVLWATVLGSVGAAGYFFALPEKIGRHGEWFWPALAVLAALFVILPFLAWTIKPPKLRLETTSDQQLIIRTSRIGKRRMELQHIEKIFVEENLATIFYRNNRGFPTSWMIERSRFHDENWKELGTALESVKTRVFS